jgi:hypothetical protein
VRHVLWQAFHAAQRYDWTIELEHNLGAEGHIFPGWRHSQEFEWFTFGLCHTERRAKREK